MRVIMNQQVPLERVQISLKGPAGDYLAQRPQSKIAGIHASRKVVVISQVVGLDRKGLLHQQRLEADDTLTYDRRTGKYEILGSGRLASSEPAPADAASAEGPPPPIRRVDISFRTGMVAESGTEHEAHSTARAAAFSGIVVLKAVPGRNLSYSQDWQITADRLRLVAAKPVGGAHNPGPHSFIVNASGHVQLNSDKQITRADSMSFELP